MLLLLDLYGLVSALWWSHYELEADVVHGHSEFIGFHVEGQLLSMAFVACTGQTAGIHAELFDGFDQHSGMYDA